MVLTQQHDQLLRRGRQVVQQRKQRVVGILGTDLVQSPLGSTVDHAHGDAGSHVADLRVVRVRNVLSGSTDDHALDRVRSGSPVDSVDRVVTEDLEDEVPEIPSTSDIVEDGCSHGLVLVGTESINEIVVVQHVHHRDRRVGLGECTASEHLAVMAANERVRSEIQTQCQPISQLYSREVVSVDGKLDLIRDLHGHLFVLVALVDPIMQLGLQGQRVAIKLISTSDGSYSKVVERKVSLIFSANAFARPNRLTRPERADPSDRASRADQPRPGRNRSRILLP
jgi:hypothetical protein